MSTEPSAARRRFGRGLAAGGLLGAVGRASGQAYPARPVQMIVGYGPGGGTDTLARVLGEPLARGLGQPVVVRNTPGAGGQIAATALLREAADGHAVLAINHPDLHLAVERSNGALKVSDFRIILVDVKDPRVLLVPKGSEFASFGDFVRRAKSQPGKLAISVAQGSAQELFARWLVARLGVDVTVVGYKSGVDSANAILSGDVAATVGDDYARFNIRDRTRALFIASADRSPRWPEAEGLTALAPFGVAPPSPDFLARYGIYVVASEFKRQHPGPYATLQRAMIDARGQPSFRDYVAKNQLQDLSIGQAGETFDAGFAADMTGIATLSR